GAAGAPPPPHHVCADAPRTRPPPTGPTVRLARHLTIRAREGAEGARFRALPPNPIPAVPPPSPQVDAPQTPYIPKGRARRRPPRSVAARPPAGCRGAGAAHRHARGGHPPRGRGASGLGAG